MGKTRTIPVPTCIVQAGRPVVLPGAVSDCKPERRHTVLVRPFVYRDRPRLDNVYTAGTQDDQDQVDEQDKQEIIMEIMKSWMDRLKLISLIVGIIIFMPPDVP